MKDELYHYGILGMKWGVKRSKPDYKSTSIVSAIARRQNDKVDASFDKWKESNVKRDNAIRLGKQAMSARIAYENNKSDEALKTAFKNASKEYKKALNENTTYRKGVVRKEVGQDAARKYLSNAKKVKKQMETDPTNTDLQDKYTRLMNRYDIERASARRAVDVALKRSNAEANFKRVMTTTVKAAATAAVIGTGVAVVNKYVLKGKINLNSESVSEFVKKAKNFMGFIY